VLAELDYWCSRRLGAHCAPIRLPSTPVGGPAGLLHSRPFGDIGRPCGCASEIRIFCEEATILTGIWGERLEIQRAGDAGLVPVAGASHGTVREQFLDVRGARMPNPSPPEVGLRMALLWDAIRTSAARGGSVVRPNLIYPIMGLEGAA
jgi:hypothetical protein